MDCITPHPARDPEVPRRVVVILIVVLLFVLGALLAGRPMDVVAGLLGAVFTTATWIENHMRPRPI